MPKLLKTPFAADAAEGYRTDVQESNGAALNSATYQIGFPPITMQSIASNGMPPKGSDLNGVLYDVTDNLVFLTQGGGYGFDSAYATSIGGYPLNAKLRLNDGTEAISTIANNTNDPNVNLTGWVKANSASQILDESGKTQQEINDSQLIFNDKYTKFKQPEANSIEQELSTRAKKKQYVGDYSSLQSALDAKRNNTSNLEVETNTTYTANTQVNLSGYTFINGSGFYSQIKLDTGGSLVYTPTGVADDHAQRIISNIQIRGDGTVGDYLTPKNGTTTGLKWTGGAYAQHSGIIFNGHDIGLSINNSYTNVNRYHYYRACKTAGLHLNNVTSHREEMIYARFNSGTAVLIEGTTQNVHFAGGAIEGNRGIAIQHKDIPALAFPKVILNDTYFESNGDLNAKVPAVDFQAHPNLHVTAFGGSYWNNALSGIITGAYRWGNSVSFENSTINGYHYSKRTSVVHGTDYASYNSAINTTGATLLEYSEPTMMTNYLPTTRVDGIGAIFQTVFRGRTATKFLQPNEITASYPHVLSKSTTTTISENTSLDYGDGSWTNIAFAATGSGGR